MRGEVTRTRKRKLRKAQKRNALGAMAGSGNQNQPAAGQHRPTAKHSQERPDQTSFIETRAATPSTAAVQLSGVHSSPRFGCQRAGAHRTGCGSYTCTRCRTAILVADGALHDRALTGREPSPEQNQRRPACPQAAFPAAAVMVRGTESPTSMLKVPFSRAANRVNLVPSAHTHRSRAR